MNRNIKSKISSIIILSFLLYIISMNSAAVSIQIFILLESEKQKLWVGEEKKIIIKKLPESSNEKIYLKNSSNKTSILSNGNILMKKSGKECLIAFTKINNINSTICFFIYDTPKLIFKDNNPFKIETNDIKQLNLEKNDYPKSYIKYKSSHQEIIYVNKKGIIKALRPGSSIITASGLDNKGAKIKILSISNEGFIRNYSLNFHYAYKYKNLMIVAHPDDEILWGGANLIKDHYFIVCITNGYNFNRASDFQKILKFTKNNGIILNYPDLQDNIQDNWTEVRSGLIKDLSNLLNYKYWDKIVTHGPEGTTGHFHHKRLSEYVTKIAKEKNMFNNLYYFGKFYKKNDIPKHLKRISYNELEIKKREVSIYKSVRRIITKLFSHFFPYENWIPAKKWERINLCQNSTFSS